MTLRNTEINREGISPSGQTRTEITFTDSWGDKLEVSSIRNSAVST